MKNKFFITIRQRFLISALSLTVFFSIFSVSTAQSPETFALPVPFSSQAPLGQWNDQRQQDGCEEASAMMAMAWIRGNIYKDKTAWRNRIVGISDWEKIHHGEYRDISAADVVAWIFKDYFSFNGATIKPVKDSAAILAELEKGNVVIAAMNGRALHNPNFTAPGPERHMILIKGYDYKTKEFITNDPGTRKGENYRYSEKIIFDALRPYKTGFEEPFGPLTKEIIVVDRNSR